MQIREWDAVVIGGGAAGLSAAQMLGRARRRTLVIDAGEPRNRFAAHMHGVLGHDGVAPAELLARGRAELDRYGVVVEAGRVDRIHDESGSLRIVRDDGAVEGARALIIAVGVRDRLPAVRGLAERWGKDVLHCPYCHGFEVADLRLGVLATSAHSIHQIELVRQWSEDVTAFTAAIEPLDEDVRVRLTARGIRIVSAPVESLVSAPDGSSAIVTADGVHPVDALFTAPEPILDIAFADTLRLVRTEEPGMPIAVDARGATSHPRVWAAGNVVAPYGTVPVAMGTGAMAGGSANAGLVAEDAAAAVTERARERAAAWEQRYADTPRTWSGRVNASLAAIAADLAPGTALDVGCGEGGDAVWLAERGWRVTGVDVSPTALRRAQDAARERGVGDRVAVLVSDGADLPTSEEYDLVTSSFLHSWEPDFPRLTLLRQAAERVAPGGRLLVISHAAPPPWTLRAHDGDGHAHGLRRPDEELAALALEPEMWEVELVETRTRTATGPDGAPAQLEDGILLLRRRRP